MSLARAARSDGPSRSMPTKPGILTLSGFEDDFSEGSFLIRSIAFAGALDRELSLLGARNLPLAAAFLVDRMTALRAVDPEGSFLCGIHRG